MITYDRIFQMIFDYLAGLNAALVDMNGEVLIHGKAIISNVKHQNVPVKHANAKTHRRMSVTKKSVQIKYILGISTYFVEMVEKTIKMGT